MCLTLKHHQSVAVIVCYSGRLGRPPDIPMYEKYYLEIVSAINRKAPLGAEHAFTWAQANAPELYAQEHALDDKLNLLWGRDTALRVPTKEFGAFKAKVLAWGRLVLMIYKKFAETKTC